MPTGAAAATSDAAPGARAARRRPGPALPGRRLRRQRLDQSTRTTDRPSPCECRATPGQALREHAGWARGIPKRYRGVSFERKPIADLDPMVLRHVREYVRRHRRPARRGPRPVVLRRRGHRQDLARHAGLQGGRKMPGRSVAIYPVTRLLAEIKETFDRDSAGSYMQLFRRLVLGRPAAPRRPGRRAAHRLGARAAVLDRQRALAGRALDRP